ncbi:MAG: hypothetical protein IKG98_01125 [Ruminococcus sp.]|nr:hypothetical protein [Ruminococcus sp.]
MKAFFDNVWTKRVVSVIAAFYTVCVCYLCYYSIYYNIHVEQRGSVAMIVSAVSVIALVLMLYTRKQIVTRICSFIILPAMLPVVLMYFDHKEILIPVIAVGVVILLLSGAGEGAKTAIGTVVLLLYIFGALGYFLFTSFFVTSSKQETYQSGESPSGLYRYRIVNTDDSSNGSTAIYIEPNYADVTYPFVTFTLKNMERVVYQVRPKCENIELSWSTQTRQQITGELNSISDDIAVHVTRAEMASLGYRYDTTLEISDVNVYELLEVGLTARDVDAIKLDDLTDDQLKYFGIGKDKAGRYSVLDPTDEILLDAGKNRGETVYFSDLSADGFDLYDHLHNDRWGSPLWKVSSNNSVKLKDLSDAQLAQLGVSESGDVLTFNGKVCFRYYVAELEDYYDTESRSLSIDLLNT